MDTKKTQETLERTFDVGASARVTIANIRGEIDVRRGDEGHVSVTAIKHLDDGNLDQIEIEIEQAVDGRVHIEARMRERGAWGWLGLWTGKPCRVDFIVRVPQTCDLSTHSISGPTTIDGLEGRFKLNTVSGKLRLSNLSGAIGLKSISGAVIGERLKGPLVLDTISGRVELNACDVPALKASTKSGRLRIETPLGEGGYRIDSISGGVTLVVPPVTRCAIDFKSVSGHVRSSVPHLDRASRSQAPIAQIRFKSISGSLNLEPLSTHVTAESPLELLKRIERGELSVDAALNELQTS